MIYDVSTRRAARQTVYRFSDQAGFKSVAHTQKMAICVKYELRKMN